MQVLDLLNILMYLLSILLMVVIFVISLLVIPAIFKIRELDNSTIKTVAYTGLGVLTFILVGVSFVMWETPSTGDFVPAQNIVMPYVQFYPSLILALALASVVFITYVEKDNYPYYFAGAGFAVLLPNIYKYVFINGRYDLALLGFVLWATIPVTWAFIFKGKVLELTTWRKKLVVALKAAGITYPVYILTSIVAVFGESGRGVDLGALAAFTDSITDVFMYILGTIWFYFLISVLIVLVMFIGHEAVLQLLNYRRVATATGIKYEKIVPVKVEQPKQKIDHYAGLIEEMMVFAKHIDEVDRLRAASTIGRFKSEYQTLAAKYSDGSKGEAEKMIKMIELKFMQKC